MFAIRAARAFTGRSLVAKFERAYHGTHDGVDGRDAPGVPDAMAGLVVELPWGDPDGIEAGPARAGRAISRRSSSSPSRAPAASARPSRRSCHSCARSPTATGRC